MAALHKKVKTLETQIVKYKYVFIKALKKNSKIRTTVLIQRHKTYG